MTSQALKEARLRLGLSQEQIARRWGCSTEAWRSWELGRNPIPFAGAFTLALERLEQQQQQIREERTPMHQPARTVVQQFINDLAHHERSDPVAALAALNTGITALGAPALAGLPLSADPIVTALRYALAVTPNRLYSHNRADGTTRYDLAYTLDGDALIVSGGLFARDVARRLADAWGTDVLLSTAYRPDVSVLSAPSKAEAAVLLPDALSVLAADIIVRHMAGQSSEER